MPRARTPRREAVGRVPEATSTGSSLQRAGHLLEETVHGLRAYTLRVSALSGGECRAAGPRVASSDLASRVPHPSCHLARQQVVGVEGEHKGRAVGGTVTRRGMGGRERTCRWGSAGGVAAQEFGGGPLAHGEEAQAEALISLAVPVGCLTVREFGVLVDPPLPLPTPGLCRGDDPGARARRAR